MSEQRRVDEAFAVTPEERAALLSGTIPTSILRRLRATSRSSFAGGQRLLLLLLPAGVALGLLTSQTRASRDLVLVALLLVPAALLGWAWFRDWRHETKVLAVRPALRVVEGRAETVRTWQYGYGECYYLHAALRFDGPVKEEVCLFEKLGCHVITGWARVFLVTVPTRRRGLAPWYETPVALELGEDTAFLAREPGKPPPVEPLRVNVPAD
jgi:hypothetical protein